MIFAKTIILMKAEMGRYLQKCEQTSQITAPLLNNSSSTYILVRRAKQEEQHAQQGLREGECIYYTHICVWEGGGEAMKETGRPENCFLK
jgi:hypothetical protein